MHPDTKPLIGVVADLNRKPKHAVHSVGDKYLDAVTAGAGAIAFILPALIDRPGGAFTDPRDVETVLDQPRRPVPDRCHQQRGSGAVRCHAG
jgi:hypothetical protein